MINKLVFSLCQNQIEDRCCLQCILWLGLTKLNGINNFVFLQLKKREAQLKQKEELADGLHLIDFEQVKENTSDVNKSS